MNILLAPFHEDLKAGRGGPMSDRAAIFGGGPEKLRLKGWS